MSTEAAIPATMPTQFIECTVYAGVEHGLYRPELGAVLTFDGRLDETRLKRALRLMLDAEPVLGCRFAAEVVPPVWERLVGLDEARLLDVDESDDPSAGAEAFIARPFDQGVDPQVRALLLRGASSDALAVRVGHYAVDGGALKEALYLLADIYRILGERPDWVPEPNVDGIRSPLVKAGLIETLLSFRQNDLALRKSDWSVPLLEGGRGPATYVSAEVRPEVFRSAVDLGKSAGATVNDIILTAYYRTLYRALGAASGSQTPLMITCELRKHLPPGTKTALSNISSAWSVCVNPVHGEGFDGTLARVVEATGEWKRAGAGRASAIGIPFISKMTRKKGSLAFARRIMSGMPDGQADKKGGAVLTNIGVVEAGRLDFGESVHVTDARLLPPVTPMGIGLGASTYRDRLHFAAGVEFTRVSEELATGIVTGTAREIEDWVAVRGTEVA